MTKIYVFSTSVLGVEKHPQTKASDKATKEWRNHWEKNLYYEKQKDLYSRDYDNVFHVILGAKFWEIIPKVFVFTFVQSQQTVYERVLLKIIRIASFSEYTERVRKRNTYYERSLLQKCQIFSSTWNASLKTFITCTTWIKRMRENKRTCV